MRTPGRCTNFDTCWLANGRRDIRVLVGDSFVCPACGEPLHAPSIESISANGIIGALAISLAMVATAGGEGYGVVRLAQTASKTNVAALHMPTPKPQAVAAIAAAAPVTDVSPVGQAVIGSNPPAQVQMIQVAASVPALQVDPSVPAVVFVAAAPPHPLVMPINFGRPHAPEDDAPAASARWRHHAISTMHRVHSAPVAVWPTADDQALQPTQGDSDSTASNDATPDQAAAPGQSASADAEQTGANVPAQQNDTAVPAATRVSSMRYDSAGASRRIARLIVPAVVRSSHRFPAYQPVAPVEAAPAEQDDETPDAS